MDNEHRDTPRPVDAPDEAPSEASATPPRGNQVPDHDDVERGEEKLDRISGN